MPFFLSNRSSSSSEWMDDPSCDTTELFNTYHQFSRVNAMISGWKHIFKSRLMPLFDDPNKQYSLLDIGFGGGDIPRKLAALAAQNDINLNITAIETDSRALQFVRGQPMSQNVTFLQCSSSKLVNEGKEYDVVISNHLMHHISNLSKMLTEAKKLSTRCVLFNDIERSDIGYVLFNLFSRPLFNSSFITHDGLTSIKRSYTKNELLHQVPQGWKVERRFPFRLLLSYTHEP